MYELKVVYGVSINGVRVVKELVFDKYSEVIELLNENGQFVITNWEIKNLENGNEMGNRGIHAEADLWEIVEEEIEKGN